MHIQFNTDSSIEGRDTLFASFRPDIEKTLERFSEHLTRLEIHVSDVNGDKKADDDVHCTLEARREGKKPNVVTNQAANPRQAVLGAVDKLKRSLESDLGRERDKARR
ncbi:MAG: hypothetical protein EA401_09125 [Planctomycetota bacterium]|nr:MAG: hypothetical protein EA401_09125 [Planctomycetota bacterium]